jgi:hypothetical protein
LKLYRGVTRDHRLQTITEFETCISMTKPVHDGALPCLMRALMSVKILLWQQTILDAASFSMRCID